MNTSHGVVGVARRAVRRWVTGVGAAVAIATLAVGAVIAQAPPPAAKPPVLAIPAAPKPASANAWLVMDHATGKVLAGENIDLRVDPASITKVMTSYVLAAELKAGRIKHDD